MVKTASGTTLGLTGIVPLKMNIEEHSFEHKFIICTKLKQPLIIGLYYLLGTRESYGPTAQHMQDSPIFFIQLNYVHKQK